MSSVVLAQSNGSAIGQFLDLLLLRGGYNAVVVQIGTALLGVAAGCVGTFAMLRKRSLMGDALAHSTLPGIAIAFLVAPMLHIEPRSLPWLLVGAAVFGVIGVLIVQFISRLPRITEDSAMAIVLSSLFGLGFVLLSYIQTLPTGNQAGLKSLILGQAAALRASDAQLMGVLAGASVLAVVLLLKEFRLVCFDRDFAASQGWPISMLDLALMGLVVLVTVIGLQAVGLVLIVALLIIPPATARLWSDRLGVVLALAACVGASSGYVGSIVSALFPRTATGGAIVLVAGAFFGVSLLSAPKQGVIAVGVRQIRLRLRIARDHALRHAHEWLDEQGAPIGAGAVVPRSVLLGGDGSLAGRFLIRYLWRKELIKLSSRGRIELTSQGAQLAIRITRAHRLWEAFLQSKTHLDPSHVHWPADLVEHALDDAILAELETTVSGSAES